MTKQPAPPTIKQPSAPAVKSPGAPALKKTSASASGPAAPPLPTSSADVAEYRERAAEAAVKGDWAAAENFLRMALRIDPRNADVVLELSKVLSEQGKSDASTAVLAGYDGSDLRVGQALAEAYVSMERFQEAERLFMDLSLREPSVAHHRYNLGLVESRMGKFDLAENAYMRAVELDPSFADARYNLALLYIRTREFTKAAEHLEAAVQQRADVDYLVNYAVVLRELNRMPTALAALEQALGIEPDNLLVLNNLGITHYVAGNRKEAQKAFTDVLNLNPNDATARSFLSKISMEPAAPPPAPAVEAPVAVQRPAAAPGKDNSVGMIQDDISKLRKENNELKEKLEWLEKEMEKQMEKMNTPKDPGRGGKGGSRESRKQTTAPSAPAGREAAPAADQPAESSRLEELQKHLAEVRAELETIRKDRGNLLAFAPEHSSTEQRLDAADQAVLRLQQQIRQLMIERDMLRAEVSVMREGGGWDAAMGSGRTNINVADLNGLLLVPGMDERLAHNVLWYRQNIGPFKALQDLRNVPGMDDGHYNQMIDHVAVGSAVNP